MSAPLLCFLIINFAIILYFKTFMKFKSNYQRLLKLPKQNESQIMSKGWSHLKSA